MKSRRLSWRRVASCAAGGVFCAVLLAYVPTSAEVMTVDFEQFQPGQVVAGELPGGGTARSDLFPYVVFSVQNLSRSPNSLVVFDSSNPTGGDYDLGTPNRDFGGPGLGTGGGSGTDGENSEPLGNVIVIAENIRDSSPVDGLVDDPDDEASGGLITANFAFSVTLDRITLLDMDDRARGSWIDLYSERGLIHRHRIVGLGNNSVQQIDLSDFEAVTRVRILLRGSGAIADFQYRINPTGVEDMTWSRIKSRFR
jgi:hypothetical protein